MMRMIQRIDTLVSLLSFSTQRATSRSGYGNR